MADLKLNKKDTLIEVSIKSSGEEWKKLLAKAKTSLFENLEIKGFRKGNVPANIAEQHIKEQQIWNKTADFLLESEYSKAIELLTTEKIATRPSFKVVSVSNDGIEAVLSSVAMPEVKIGDRNSIKIEFKVDEATKEEINKEVEQLDGLLKESESVDSDVKDGDIVNIDFVGSVDGKEFEGGKSESFDLTIGSKQFIEGFEEQLIGCKKNDEKTVIVTFPETYPSEELKGKEAKFIVKVNDVKRMKELEGDELVKKIKSFGFESKEAIISKIKEVANEKKIEEANDKFFREYIDAVAKLSDTKLTIPDEIVKSEVDVEFKRVEAQISQQGMSMDQYLKMMNMDEKQFKESTLVESSKKRIKDGLIYQQLIEDLSISIEESEIESEYSNIAKNSKTSVEEVKKQVQKASVESNIVFIKLIEALKK